MRGTGTRTPDHLPSLACVDLTWGFRDGNRLGLSPVRDRALCRGPALHLNKLSAHRSTSLISLKPENENNVKSYYRSR